jgi:hypothetical protein
VARFHLGFLRDLLGTNGFEVDVLIAPAVLIAAHERWRRRRRACNRPGQLFPAARHCSAEVIRFRRGQDHRIAAAAGSDEDQW